MPANQTFGVVFLPLLAAVLFAFAALMLKLAAKHKIDIWRINFVSTLATTIAFQPFWLSCEALPPIHLWWQPFIVASLFIIGQVLTLLSLTRGEVSIAAPVLGIKLLVVPIFIALIGAGSLPAMIWPACGLATLAVVLLNYSNTPRGQGSLWFSVVAAGLGASAFAMFDVYVQLWSSDWGQGGFLPVMCLFSTLISLGFIPFFQQPKTPTPAAGKTALWLVGFFFAAQALAIVASVAFWQQAAAANVVYSSRGLWSLIVISAVGARWGIADTSLNSKTFPVRLVGAFTLLAAIVVLLW